MMARTKELALLLAQSLPAAAPAAKQTPQAPLTLLTPLTPLFFSYQPEIQFAFFFERLIDVNLYSIPTLMAKFTSYCA